MTTGNERIYRKAINFDLLQAKIKEYYPNSRTKAYSDIKAFFKKNDFEWRQGSGYISKEPLSNADIYELSDRLHAALPWLKECVKEIDVTNIAGDVHSMKSMLEFAAIAQSTQVNKENEIPPSKKSIYQRISEIETQAANNGQPSKPPHTASKKENEPIL